jgi:hypothetical protein
MPPEFSFPTVRYGMACLLFIPMNESLMLTDRGPLSGAFDWEDGSTVRARFVDVVLCSQPD